MARISPPPLRSTTGIQGLDAVLHGGLIAGSLYLLERKPGAGKTTLALQYLREGVRLGEACLYATLSETADELVAGASSHGWDLMTAALVDVAPPAASPPPRRPADDA